MNTHHPWSIQFRGDVFVCLGISRRKGQTLLFVSCGHLADLPARRERIGKNTCDAWLLLPARVRAYRRYADMSLQADSADALRRRYTPHPVSEAQFLCQGRFYPCKRLRRQLYACLCKLPAYRQNHQQLGEDQGKNPFPPLSVFHDQSLPIH